MIKKHDTQTIKSKTISKSHTHTAIGQDIHLAILNIKHKKKKSIILISLQVEMN